MTASAQKRRPGAKRRAKTPLPESAGRAVIGGKEFILIPAADFEEWYEDRMLAAISAERLKLERHLAVPIENVIRRLDGKRNNK